MATSLRARGSGGGHAVLLHGFSLTGASWDPVRAGLTGRLEVVAPDIRGHGAAGAARPVNLEAVLDDLSPLLAPGGVLCGYSMGGRLALHGALKPGLAERIGRLVLIGASPGLADGDERAARRAADERLAGEIETMSIEQVAERWARTPVLSGQPIAVRRAAHAQRLRCTPAGLAAALRGLGTGALPPLWERLGELRMPVTLIVGARDHKFGQIAQEMATLIPAAEVVEIAGAGHAVQLEAPQAVAEVLAGATGRTS